MSRFGWAYVNDIITGSGGTPGGTDKAIQFASGSTFSGSTNFTFDYNTNTVRLTGTLYADNLVVSSSQILKSGSTIFGDDPTDTHQFTGSVYLNNPLYSVNVLSSSDNLYVGGSTILQAVEAYGTVKTYNSLSGTTAQFTTLTGSQIKVGGSTLTTTGSLIVNGSTKLGAYGTDTHIISGSVYLDNTLNVNGSTNLTGNLRVVGQVSASNSIITNSDITSVGNISSLSGIISASSGLTSGGSVTAATDITANGILSGTSLQIANGGEFGGPVTVTGTVSASIGLQTAGTITAGTNLTVENFATIKNGLIVTGSSTVSGNLTVLGTMSASFINGNGTSITDINGSNVNGVGDDWALQFKEPVLGVLSSSANLTFTGSNLILTGSLYSTSAIKGGYMIYSSSVSIPNTSYFVGFYSNSGVLTASLLAANSYPQGQILIFKDVGGYAGTNNILIKASGSQTIDGASGVSLTANSSSVSIISNGSNEFYIVGIV